jgi:hypothetical protein
VLSYDDTQANLGVVLSSSSGLITDTDYGTSTTATSTTAGDVVGYVKDTKVQEGSSGTAITQGQTQDILQSVNAHFKQFGVSVDSDDRRLIVESTPVL